MRRRRSARRRTGSTKEPARFASAVGSATRATRHATGPDVALFTLAMTHPWHLERGASVTPGAGVHFSVWAPRAKSVRVRLTSDSEHELTRGDHGVFEAFADEARVGADYGF